jgi:hypothetical protein
MAALARPRCGNSRFGLALSTETETLTVDAETQSAGSGSGEGETTVTSTTIHTENTTNYASQEKEFVLRRSADGDQDTLIVQSFNVERTESVIGGGTPVRSWRSVTLALRPGETESAESLPLSAVATVANTSGWLRAGLCCDSRWGGSLHRRALFWQIHRDHLRTRPDRPASRALLIARVFELTELAVSG